MDRRRYANNSVLNVKVLVGTSNKEILLRDCENFPKGSLGALV